jgi:hypothetical protein
MADLTAAAPLRFRWDNQLFIEKWVLDNSVAQTVYRGAPLMLDVSADTVHPRIFVTGAVANDDVFVGIALENKVVLTTDHEPDNVIELAGPGSVVGFKSTVFTNADVGKSVGFSDTATLVAVAIAGAANNRCPIGHLLRVEDGYAYVKLLNYPAIVSGI